MEEKVNAVIRTDVVIIKNGPIKIGGLPVMLVQSDGNVVESKSCYLCRCGASKNKPYCDGSHKIINYTCVRS
jgi:CDGSH-type Zn-finger protein